MTDGDGEGDGREGGECAGLWWGVGGDQMADTLVISSLPLLRQLKAMIERKNAQLKETRGRLSRYEPDSTAVENDDDEGMGTSASAVGGGAGRESRK